MRRRWGDCLALYWTVQCARLLRNYRECSISKTITSPSMTFLTINILWPLFFSDRTKRLIFARGAGPDRSDIATTHKLSQLSLKIIRIIWNYANCFYNWASLSLSFHYNFNRISSRREQRTWVKPDQSYTCS